MTDEGVREIQLSGKQLVFLFMSATVVAVVIFLCGVMVGRGVPVRAGTAIGVSGQAVVDPTAASPSEVVPAATTSVRDPGATAEALSYPALLSSDGGIESTLVPVSEATGEVRDQAARPPVAESPRPAATPKPAVASQPAVAAPPRPVPSPRVTPPAGAPRTVGPPAPTPSPTLAEPGNLTEPEGDGFVVQVAAVRQRTDANNIARRLSGKGYRAFVTTAGANFRVRVGKYSDRREAETVARRLEQEERFKPWVTR